MTALVFTPLIAASSSIFPAAVLTATPQTLAAYNIWYQAGRITFTATANDVVALDAFINMTISAITASGTDRLALFFRGRLYNNTLVNETWAGTRLKLAYHRIGAVDFGDLTLQENINERFTTNDLLVAGHSYTWFVEAMKQQEVGTPTMTVIINDETISVDAAARNF